MKGSEKPVRRRPHNIHPQRQQKRENAKRLWRRAVAAGAEIVCDAGFSAAAQVAGAVSAEAHSSG